MWDNHEFDRQIEGVGLIFDELPSDPVHGNAVELLANAGDELDDLDAGMALASVVQGEGAVFAPAPKEGGFLGCVH